MSRLKVMISELILTLHCLLKANLENKDNSEFSIPFKAAKKRRKGQIFNEDDNDKAKSSLLVFQSESLKQNFVEAQQLPPEWSFGELALISK